MSWLSIPLPNPFKSLHSSDDEEEQQKRSSQPSSPSKNDAISSHSSGGVKDDFSAIGESIGRQLRGVAAFLAPPPSVAGDVSSLSSSAISGIRSDLAEIGGSFKNSLSLFSTNTTVAGISKLASDFLQLNEEDNDDRRSIRKDNDDEEEEFEGVGITDDVVDFASQISNRPELWTDFPLSISKEFQLSDAQSEHASVIEQLVPDLADLRSRLNDNMTDNDFWMIYFILLLPRLNDDDLELLSSPEIVEAREMLLLMLRNKKDTTESENPQSGGSSELSSDVDDKNLVRSHSVDKIKCETSNVSSTSGNNEFDDNKKLIKEEDTTLPIEVTSENSNNRTANKGRQNVDTWSGGEKAVTRTETVSRRFQSEDDVSFSDLEDDDNDSISRRSESGPTQSTRASSPEGSTEWVQLNKNIGTGGSQLRDQSNSQDRDSEGDESNDWLTVDDFDP